MPVNKGDRGWNSRNNFFRQLVIMSLIFEHRGGGGIGYRGKTERKLAGGDGDCDEADFFAINIKDRVEGSAIEERRSQQSSDIVGVNFVGVEMVGVHLSADDAGGNCNIHSADFYFIHIHVEQAIGIKGWCDFESDNQFCTVDVGGGCDNNPVRSEIDRR